MAFTELKKLVENSENIVFFGGAGTSTESNIPDFRSVDGLYVVQDRFCYSPEEMLSHEFFVDHTEEFFQFYTSKMIYKEAKPNRAHTALVELEKRGKLKAMITQNIDGLHQMAGSMNVLELHGSVHRNFCVDCGRAYSLNYILSNGIIPRCESCNGIVKPDVVLYGEALDQRVMGLAISYILEADILIIGGTSLAVYPAAGLIDNFSGSKLVLINKTSTTNDRKAHIVIHDSIGKVLTDVLGDG